MQEQAATATDQPFWVLRQPTAPCSVMHKHYNTLMAALLQAGRQVHAPHKAMKDDGDNLQPANRWLWKAGTTRRDNTVKDSCRSGAARGAPGRPFQSRRSIACRGHAFR